MAAFILMLKKAKKRIGELWTGKGGGEFFYLFQELGSRKEKNIEKSSEA